MEEVAPGFLPKRKPGRPPKPEGEKKSLASGRAPLRASDFTSGKVASLEPDEGEDRLKIPRELIPDGVDMQWVTDSIFGQPQPDRRARFQRRGWQSVHTGDFEGRFDYFMPTGYKGEISVEGLVLHCRPMEMTKQARRIDNERARQQVAIKEQQMRGGDVQGVTLDTRHQSALKTNRVSKSYERIPVPEE